MRRRHIAGFLTGIFIYNENTRMRVFFANHGSSVPWKEMESSTMQNTVWNRSFSSRMPLRDAMIEDTMEVDIRFIDIPILPDSPWSGKPVRKLNLPPGTLLVFLRRIGENLVPNGDTVIQEHDVLVLGASACAGDDDVHLTEIDIDVNHNWCGKAVMELELPGNSLIILIRRDDESLIPNGRTLIQAGDLIVLNTVR